MVSSMTAYASTESKQTQGQIKCEIKSINHRYLDLTLRLPERLRGLEFPLRELTKQYLHRGKVECVIHWENDHTMSAKPALNMPALKQLAETYQAVTQVFQGPLPNPLTLSLTEILNWPAVYTPKDTLESFNNEKFREVFTQTLEKLVSLRLQEGSALTVFIFQRLDIMTELAHKIKSRVPLVLQHQRDKILARLNDVKTELNPDRLEQEMVYFAQKIDISEELDRLLTHIESCRSVLKKGGVIGRQLDFLMQELNREANTLSSKSTEIQIIQMSMEMKVLIEQIREQVQNLE